MKSIKAKIIELTNTINACKANNATLEVINYSATLKALSNEYNRLLTQGK